MYRIAVCDDDALFLEKFEQQIIEVFREYQEEAEVTRFQDGFSLIESLEKQKKVYDVIFLDVEMPGINGFQTAQKLQEWKSVSLLIFTTYIEHQSREGYRYGAFRYLFKNNLAEELREAVGSITNRLREQQEAAVTFKYRNAGELETAAIRPDDIIYIRKEKTRRAILKTLYGEYELLTKPLQEYQKELDKPYLVLAVRNYLVNFNRIEGIEEDYFLMEGGDRVPLGVNRQVRKNLLEQYMHFLERRLLG